MRRENCFIRMFDNVTSVSRRLLKITALIITNLQEQHAVLNLLIAVIPVFYLIPLIINNNFQLHSKIIPYAVLLVIRCVMQILMAYGKVRYKVNYYIDYFIFIILIASVLRYVDTRYTVINFQVIFLSILIMDISILIIRKKKITEIQSLILRNGDDVSNSYHHILKNKSLFVINHITAIAIMSISREYVIYISPIIVLIIFVFYIVKPRNLLKLEKQYMGYDKNDFFELPIVELNPDSEIYKKDIRALKISFAKFFPSNIKAYVIHATYNRQYHFGNEINLIEKPELLIVCSFSSKGRFFLKSVKVYAEDFNCRWIGNFDIELRFGKVGNENIVTEAKVIDFSIRKDLFGFWNKKRHKILPKNLMKLYSQYYYADSVNFDYINKDFSRLGLEDRGFILMNGKLGMGKTVYANYFSINKDFIPIMISLWNNNYNHNLLFAIFRQVRIQTKKMWTGFGREVVLPCIGVFVSLCIAALNLIENKKNFGHLNIIIYKLTQSELVRREEAIYNIVNTIFTNEIFAILFVVILWFASLRLIPEYIIFQKNSIHYYQNYFLNYIYKELNRKRYLLVIEDIDRLSDQEILEAFKVLSNINEKFHHSTKLIGIISLDIEKIKDKLTETKTRELIEKTLIQNSKILTNYKDIDLQCYLMSILDFYFKCSGTHSGISDYEEFTNGINFEIINLRELRGIFDLLIDLLDSKNNNGQDWLKIKEFLCNFKETSNNEES